MFCPGNRMSGDDGLAGKGFGDGIGDRLLARSDIADDRVGLQGAAQSRRCVSHGAHRHAEHHEISVGDRIARIVEHRMRKAAFAGTIAHGLVRVIGGDTKVRQRGLCGKADGAADQAKPDDRDLTECALAHDAALAALRRAAAMSSICASVPMVMRNAWGRPWPGRCRTA